MLLLHDLFFALIYQTHAQSENFSFASFLSVTSNMQHGQSRRTGTSCNLKLLLLQLQLLQPLHKHFKCDNSLCYFYLDLLCFFFLLTFFLFFFNFSFLIKCAPFLFVLFFLFATKGSHRIMTLPFSSAFLFWLLIYLVLFCAILNFIELCFNTFLSFAFCLFVLN